MIRLRLAALTLIAGLGLLSGCSASYSFGRPDGGGGLGLGLFGHGGGLFNCGRNGTTVSALPDCCPTVGAPDCCGIGGMPGVGGPILDPGGVYGGVPPMAVPTVPPSGIPAPPAPGMPMLTEPPLGSNTKLSPVPYSVPFPYSPAKYQ
jgi:hypothetical protein